MNMMNDLEVIINNKRYTISGYESEEYLQKIASYLNSKYSDFKTKEGYNHLDLDLRNVLMQINLADDYFKMSENSKNLEAELEKKDKEMFELKHNLVSIQKKLEELTEKYEAATKQTGNKPVKR
ncbi:MAG: cell division protein ZapA [Lachnospiraceae bacterium]|nr:cell division protein ZapA [Lachnospiraceae bacterium]